MSAIPDNVADGREASAVRDRDVFDLVKPSYIEDSPLAAHMEGLQVFEVGLVYRPGLRGVEQYGDN